MSKLKPKHPATKTVLKIKKTFVHVVLKILSNTDSTYIIWFQQQYATCLKTMNHES